MNRRELLKYSIAASATSLFSSVLPFGSVRAEEEESPSRSFIETPALSAEQVAERLAKLRSRKQRVNPPTKEVMEAFSRFPMPVLLYDLAQVEENYLTFLEAKSDVDVHFAVKCCPNPRILQHIALLGGGFDFASPAELDLSLGTGVNVEKCIYSNTVKHPSDIRYAFGKGVKAFVADSEHEVRKLAENAPGSLLYIRLLVNSHYAAHPLGEKFGTTPENARKLLRLGKQLGLVPYGTHFHVGTQCVHPEAWVEPSRQAAAIFRDMKAEGIELKLFDIGGGYPAPYLSHPDIPTVKDILGGVEKILKEELPDQPVKLAVEPGRGIAATAGALSTRVMLRAPRADGEWLHLEVGYYQGLNEVTDHYVYPITVAGRNGSEMPYTLCGPTCDSADTISKGQKLPNDITEGDLMVFQNSAAYSEACDTHFNGIEPPMNRYLDEVMDLG